MHVVNGLEFQKNPENYIESPKCIRFLMGGFMTDCNINPENVAETIGKITFYSTIIIASVIIFENVKKIDQKTA